MLLFIIFSCVEISSHDCIVMTSEAICFMTAISYVDAHLYELKLEMCLLHWNKLLQMSLICKFKFNAITFTKCLEIAWPS